ARSAHGRSQYAAGSVQSLRIGAWRVGGYAEVRRRVRPGATRQSTGMEGARRVGLRSRDKAAEVGEVGSREACGVEGNTADRRCSDSRDPAAGGERAVRHGISRLMLLVRRVLL